MKRLFITVLIAAVASCSSPSILQMKSPIDGLREADLRDMFHEERGDQDHEAIDIMMPRGTPVRAVVAGKIQKLFLSKPGGITIYQFDEKSVYCYYYAHLDRYADGLIEGKKVKPGDVIGFVGSTGNADPRAPHLHFAIFELGPAKKWFKGTSINPYPYLVAAVRNP